MAETVQYATWLSAIFTTVYAIAFVVSMLFLIQQLQLLRQQNTANIMKDCFDRFERTEAARQSVYDASDFIVTVNSEEALRSFKKDNPHLHSSIRQAFNAFQYLGMVIRANMLTEDTKKVILSDIAPAFYRLHRIAGVYLETEIKLRAEEGARHDKYMQHVALVKEELDRLTR